MPHVLSLPGWSLRPKPCVRGLPSCRRAPLSPQAEHWAGYWQMQERSLSLRSRTLFPRGPLPPCSTSWRGVTWSQGWGGGLRGAARGRLAKPACPDPRGTRLAGLPPSNPNKPLPACSFLPPGCCQSPLGALTHPSFSSFHFQPQKKEKLFL